MLTIGKLERTVSSLNFLMEILNILVGGYHMKSTSYFGLKLLIQFTFNHHSATYLPEVAFEQGWTQERTVESLVRKAGFNGVISVDLLCEIKCVRYQSSKQKLTYSNYIAALGHDPIQSLNDDLRSSSSSPRHRTWKDIFHL